MQANKKLILIVIADMAIATLSSLGSTSYALEESLVLMLALTAARSLIATPPSIEVTSTESVLLRGGNALPLSDTQCMFTETPEETPEEQICFGNNLPTRIRLLPAAPLNIGLLPNAISQVEYRLLPVLVTDPFFPDIGAWPEPELAFAIATEIQKSAERQREIIEVARQKQQIFSSHSYKSHSYKSHSYKSHSYDKSYNKRLDELGEKGIETDTQDFEWWWLWEPDPDTDDSDMATVHDDDSILLEPDSRYCFFSSTDDESQARNQAATDEESGSEEDTSSGEDSDSEPEDEADSDSDSDSSIKITHTSTDPLPVSKEIDNYYSTFMLKKIKTEPVYDNDTPFLEELKEIAVEKTVVEAETGSTVCQSFNSPPAKKKKKKKKQTSSGSKKYPCPHSNCRKSYATQHLLYAHKRRDHTGQQTCDEAVVENDGLVRPCGKLYKNAQALSDHKRKSHSGEQTCDVTVVMEDGLVRLCGKLCKNAQALSDHKRRFHSREQTCDVIVVEDDGQERLCGKICNSAKGLSDHKNRYHTGERTCDKTVTGEDGQERLCGKLCKNAQAFSDHKQRYHTKKQTCDETVVGKDGQERLCGKVCNNVKALSDHKRIHLSRKRKRKHDDADPD